MNVREENGKIIIYCRACKTEQTEKEVDREGASLFCKNCQVWLGYISDLENIKKRDGNK